MSAPALRFPEFAEEWTPSHAGDAFTNSKAKGEAGLPIYSVTLDRGLVRRDSLDRHMAADAADETNLRAQEGELVYNMMRMWQGAIGKAELECMVSPAYVVLKPKAETSPDFFDQWFKSARMLYLLWAYSHGLTSDRLRLYFRDFAQIPLHLPSLSEQKKIAAFLGAVDARIAGARKQRDLLETYKRGLIQALFSRTLRFTRDDGTAFPDWEKKRLGELTKWSSGGTPSKEIAEFWDGDIPWISALSMHVDHVSESHLSITKEAVKAGSRLAPEGAILLLVRGSMLYKRIPISRTLRQVAFNQDVKCLISHRTMSEIFLFYWLKSSEHQLLSMVVGTGIGAGKLDTKELQSLAVRLPHPDEQQKIADALSAMDAKIDAVAGQIAQLEAFKKGLLQQMFV